MERAIVTRDPALREVLALAERIAPRRGPVVIEGERGTGKSLLARHLHALGGAARPYVVVDCAMRPAAALARELFGADDGGEPSTGAIAAARGGTLVLDEVCDLDAALQTRLLRALEDERPLEVRLVATSRRPLAATVASGAFRDDLWTRLSVVTLVAAAAAGAPRRRRGPGGAHPRPCRARPRPGAVRRRPRDAAGARLAGQRARARARGRASGTPGRPGRRSTPTRSLPPGGVGGRRHGWIRGRHRSRDGAAADPRDVAPHPAQPDARGAAAGHQHPHSAEQARDVPAPGPARSRRAGGGVMTAMDERPDRLVRWTWMAVACCALVKVLVLGTLWWRTVADAESPATEIAVEAIAPDDAGPRAGVPHDAGGDGRARRVARPT